MPMMAETTRKANGVAPRIAKRERLQVEVDRLAAVVGSEENGQPPAGQNHALINAIDRFVAVQPRWQAIQPPQA